MTINSFNNGIVSNLVLGGVAAVIILAAMMWKASRVAESGNKAKMATWSMAPALMVIAALITHSVAAGGAIPRLQAMFQSAPAANTVALGNSLTALADNLLFGSGEAAGTFVGPAAFTAAQPTSNTGAVSFVTQPAPGPARPPTHHPGPLSPRPPPGPGAARPTGDRSYHQRASGGCHQQPGGAAG